MQITNKSLITIAITALFLVGCNQNNYSNNKTLSTPTTTPYTIQQISEHATKSDCWFAIEGKVYDVTDFIASGQHEGGDIIIQGCGKDATELFNKRPGSNSPHSSQAKSMLQNFQIGTLSN